jgi:hypothetical protein
MMTARSNESPRRRASTAWIALGFAVTGLSSLPARSQAPGGDVLFYSHRFAVDLTSPGASRLVVFGGEGTEERAVTLAADQLPILGPGEFYALLGGTGGAAGRALEVYAATGDLRGRFAVAADRAPAIGTEVLLLQPRADHQPIRRFEVEFLSFAGASLASYTRPDLFLVSVEPLESGYWLMSSERVSGGWHIHVFGPNGTLRWNAPSPGTNPPVVVLAPDGSRAAVGVARDDLSAVDLRLHGLAGGLLSTRSVILFQHASFSSDTRYLVLAGHGQVELLAGADGTPVWQGSEPLRLAAGEAVAFSALGPRFFLLGQSETTDGTPGRAVLATYSIAGRDVTRTELAIDLDPGTRLTVADLDELPDGRLRVVTDRGVWSLTP